MNVDFQPGDRVLASGRPGTYYSRSESGEFHTIKLDDSIYRDGWFDEPKSAFVFYTDDHPALQPLPEPT